MISEDDFSCTICQSLFTDPRMLPCGHSFCRECIADWRKQSRECPVCRGNIGPIELPKNIALAGLVEQYKEQNSNATDLCSKCSATDSNCRHCQHCHRYLCSDCTKNHVKKLHSQLIHRVSGLKGSLMELESGMEAALLSQTTWSEVQISLDQAHTELTAALNQVNTRIERLSSSVQSRLEAVHSARDSLTALEKTSATDAAAIARGFVNANQLAQRLETDSKGDILGPPAHVEAANRVAKLTKDLCAAATEAVAAGSIQLSKQPHEASPLPRLPARPAVAAPKPPSPGSLQGYYANFPQRHTSYFSVVGSVVAISACWNTAGFRYGRGFIVSNAKAAELERTGGTALMPLPDEVLVLIEGVPPHTKVKMYEQTGSYLGIVNLCQPDGQALGGPPSYSLAVNSPSQLLAVSIPKANAVLVTQLDGTAKHLVTSCNGLDLANPLGVCISNAGEVYIADYKNNRICRVCCRTGRTLKVYTHNAFAKVDRIALWEPGGAVYARIDPCHLLQVTEVTGQGCSDREQISLKEIKRKFFHFVTDADGRLLFSSGGASDSGQLRLIAQPTGDDIQEKQLLNWPDVKYSCLTALRNGRIVVSAANKKEIHLF